MIFDAEGIVFVALFLFWIWALLDCIAILERCLDRKAQLDLLPMQPGDVVSTMADVTALEDAVGFRPNTPLEEGIQDYVANFLSQPDPYR